MGVGPSFAATSTDSRSIAESSSVPDEVINPHPRGPEKDTARGPCTVRAGPGPVLGDGGAGRAGMAW